MIDPRLHFQPAYAIVGVRHITNPNGDQDWRDEHGMASWLEVDFNGSQNSTCLNRFSSLC